MTERGAEHGRRTHQLKRVEYWIDVSIAVGASMMAGITMIAEHPALADPMARGALAGLFALFSILSVKNSRNNWLRLHGISPIAVKLDAVTEDWNNE